MKYLRNLPGLVVTFGSRFDNILSETQLRLGRPGRGSFTSPCWEQVVLEGKAGNAVPPGSAGLPHARRKSGGHGNPFFAALRWTQA